MPGTSSSKDPSLPILLSDLYTPSLFVALVRLVKTPTKDDNLPKLHLLFDISDRSSFSNAFALESAAKVAMIALGGDVILQWQMGQFGIDFFQQAAQNMSPQIDDTSNPPENSVSLHCESSLALPVSDDDGRRPHPLHDDAFCRQLIASANDGMRLLNYE